MPHTKSAEKSIRQDEKRRLRNKARLRALKKLIKNFEDAAKAKPGSDEAKTAFRAAVGKLDQAASKRTIHPNAAARKKSQLAKKLSAKP
ncbi:MAG: 30S ribosomal protein S20 [Gemmataceae bacterium]|nr:30S ribosomal protein S20 [Gemmataceae bacterium]